LKFLRQLPCWGLFRPLESGALARLTILHAPGRHCAAADARISIGRPDYWRSPIQNSQYRGIVTIDLAEIQAGRCHGGHGLNESLACNVENKTIILHEYFVAASILFLRRIKKLLRMPSISGPSILAFADVEWPLSTLVGRNT
jgi:hypothetical protein